MKKTFALLLLICPALCFQIQSCRNTSRFKSKKAEKGYELAKQFCVNCHLLPEPSALNKETWLNYVLPKMGTLLGFRSLGAGSYISNQHAVMPLDDWNNIVLYYYTGAPKEPIAAVAKSIKTPAPLFAPDRLVYNIKQPATTMVQIDSATKQFLFADGQEQKLFAVKNKVLIDSFSTEIGVANVRATGKEYWVLSMGVLYPSNEKLGKLMAIDAATKKQTIILDSLQRPVDVIYGDLDLDGLEDMVVCEFGNTTGALSWFKNRGNNSFNKQVLRPLPGAIKSILYDFNKDGKPDIVALMAQGDEGVFIYYNLGNGVFREERKLRFPPSYGSNSMQLIDINNDGFIDIVTTNGDNGDYPPILKAYHGARIFINDGKNGFNQQSFLPQHGVGKALAYDYDNDGDIDIASIAYFPDFTKTPQEAFIFWQNGGKGKFRPYSINEVKAGRWIVMNAGDIDGDGDLDIVLGNANFRLGNVPLNLKQKWDSLSPSYLVLSNKLH